ncbi:cytochrome P450 [Streptomyces sp. MUSC 125]|uniref:cytochrome P450 n=1 Tax=unclassified Streptomyces TaxID=2593676 RepID=UPI00057D84BF|nr:MULTISPECIES: cytochrome P450 [unclassified Streptomyces]KIE25920.1 cytochrome P450 [Streptomyces sp. MUSC 125]MCH0557205.1 cytochrome P450 [Streptomyces sp. MUM 16J]
MHHQHDAAEIPPACPAHGNVQLFGPGFGSDPERFYTHLRSLGPSAPVDIAPGVEVELVTSYEAALSILQNPHLFVRDSRRWNALNEGRVPPDSPALPMMGYRPNALFSDGAAHARLRLAVTDSLATVNELQLVRKVQQSADYLISRFSSESRGQAELMAEYAQPLPLLVFSDLFGCPPELGDRVIAGITGIFEGTSGADEALGGALTELIALKHRNPGADVTTRLMHHPAGLSDEEVLHQLVTLLSGGTAPLAAAIGTSCALYFSEDWPVGLPVEDAVAQTLWRYAPIANYAAHYPTQDIELGGRSLRANDPVLISFAAANTDPALTEHSEQLGGKAHLAFGAGPHACPAKDLASLIVVSAVESVLNRLPDVEMRVPFKALAWGDAPWSRSLVTLPIRFTPRAVPSAVPVGRPVAEAADWSAAPVQRSAPAPGPAAAPAAPRPRQGLFSRFLAWTRGEV